MKNKSHSRSGFFNFRILTGLSVFLGGVFLAIFATANSAVPESRSARSQRHEAKASLGASTHRMATIRNTSVRMRPKPSDNSATVIHAFEPQPDGKWPSGTLLAGKNGELFGTTRAGGSNSFGGTVYRLTPNGSGTYTEDVIYSFDGKSVDGWGPSSAPIADDTGVLYGTAAYGGTGENGVVYKLTPSGTTYTYSVIYRFLGGMDGTNPYSGLIRDESGALYGTTYSGGGGACSGGCGTVFKLTPSNGGYTESVLYAFQSGNDGEGPSYELLLAAGGVLYGTTSYGGSAGWGTVFQLTPSGQGYTEQVLYPFQLEADGGLPSSGLVADEQGVLYGTTAMGGVPDPDLCPSGCGIVFKVNPTSATEEVVYSFQGGTNAWDATGTLLRDGAGNLYGSTASGGSSANCDVWGCGTVYELQRMAGGSYSEIILYSFNAAPDGEAPLGIIFGQNGDIFGATSYGGDFDCSPEDGGCGTAFQLTLTTPTPTPSPTVTATPRSTPVPRGRPTPPPRPISPH
jgi:uncharacterized repeat protein (TIGR03803 family)